MYVSWYADGVRILDVADPTRPREVGYFVPTASSPTAATDVPATAPTVAAAAAATAPVEATTADQAADAPTATLVAQALSTPEAAESSQAPRRGSIWGVYPRGDLILASDQHLGLFVLRDRTR